MLREDNYMAIEQVLEVNLTEKQKAAVLNKERIFCVWLVWVLESKELNG
jgi:hypothetical protein